MLGNGQTAHLKSWLLGGKLVQVLGCRLMHLQGCMEVCSVFWCQWTLSLQFFAFVKMLPQLSGSCILVRWVSYSWTYRCNGLGSLFSVRPPLLAPGLGMKRAGHTLQR